MDTKKEIEVLVGFIKDQVINVGKTGCVVGVSGGVDSAVTVLLCKIAFPNSTYGISMPGNVKYTYQEDEKTSDSTQRALTLCCDHKIPLFRENVHFDIDGSSLNPVNKYTKGNYLARKRMAILYYYAECLNSFVVGTDNKCESFIGYFTKYGDGGVDINPLGEYLKSEVYELGKELGVTKAIMTCSPSAELYENQTDEEELGFSYKHLENFITNPEAYKGFPEEVAVRIREMHAITEHKRNLPPVCMRLA